MPPDRNAPSGTSAIMRRPTASCSSVSNCSVSSASLPSSGLKHAVARHGAGVPEARNLRFALPRQRQDRAGFELVNALIDRMRRRNVIVPHERGDGVAVDARRPARMRAQRFEFRAEQKQFAELCPIQRLDAEPIANERQRPLAPVPQRDREHADHALERRLDAVYGERFQYDFGVGMTAEFTPARGKLGGDRLVTIYLAVVGDDKSLIGGDHRLMPAGERSMIESRRWISAVPASGSRQMPWSSGPRCDKLAAICSAIASTVAAGNTRCSADEACNAAHRYRSASNDRWELHIELDRKQTMKFFDCASSLNDDASVVARSRAATVAGPRRHR